MKPWDCEFYQIFHLFISQGEIGWHSSIFFAVYWYYCMSVSKINQKSHLRHLGLWRAIFKEPRKSRCANWSVNALSWWRPWKFWMPNDTEKGRIWVKECNCVVIFWVVLMYQSSREMEHVLGHNVYASLLCLHWERHGIWICCEMTCSKMTGWMQATFNQKPTVTILKLFNCSLSIFSWNPCS